MLSDLLKRDEYSATLLKYVHAQVFGQLHYRGYLVARIAWGHNTEPLLRLDLLVAT